MVIDDRLADTFTDPKAVLNRGVGFLLLAYSAPLLAALAIAVRLDTGRAPILAYTGQDQGAAALWRFRTARRDDGSDTAFGGFLRQIRLELLPQFANVARGDITIGNALR